MDKYKPSYIHVLSIVGHGSSGKTSLAESMLYYCGGTDRLGRVEEGNTVSDYDPEEIKRKISINTSIIPLQIDENLVYMLDTPGFSDFIGEVYSSIRVSDGVLLTVCCASGVEVGTEKAWNICQENKIPVIIVINKVDRESSDFYAVLSQMEKEFGDSIAAITLPIGRESSFKGYVDLLTGKAYVYDGVGKPKINTVEIPADLKDRYDEHRNILIERIIETDDELLSKYLDGEDIALDELAGALKSAVLSRKLIPVLCASAAKSIAVDNIIQYLISGLPSPADAGEIRGIDPKTNKEVARKPDENEPFSAFVFKTMADPYIGKLTIFRIYSGHIKSDTSIYNSTKDKTERIGQLMSIKGKTQIPITRAIPGMIAAVAKLTETETSDTICDKDNRIGYPKIQFPEPVMSMAVEPKAKGDEEKISSGLARLMEEDPTFRVHQDIDIKQLIVSGMGEQHISVIMERLKRKFGIDVVLTVPKIAYKETIKKNAKQEYKHKKQSGGRGQYGHVFLELKPRERGAGIEFINTVFGGAIPKNYIPSVEKGVMEALEEGVLADYPVVDVSVNLYDGSFHTVDSSDMAFKIAGLMAFKKGFMEADPVLLEPIMNLSVIAPEQYVGDLMGDINSKRGRILGVESYRDNLQEIKAQVPLAELSKYHIDLKSIAHGRGSFKMELSHYEEVPPFIAEKIIAESKKSEE
ncbi:MAG: elongation factor G [Actinobacteria bacterium]|nr:elongation factor G [Actinomycetota bacterium]